MVEEVEAKKERRCMVYFVYFVFSLLYFFAYFVFVCFCFSGGIQGSGSDIRRCMADGMYECTDVCMREYMNVYDGGSGGRERNPYIRNP